MDLPPTLRLSRHTAVLAPAGGVRVLGTDPATAVVVEDLAPPLATVLERLVAPASTAVLVAEAAAGGVPVAVTTRLLADLHERGLLVDAAQADRITRSRAGAVVDVHGRGPLVAGIVCGLLLAGVGTVRTATGGAVRAGDLGTGLVEQDVGRPRLAAVQAAVGRLLPGRTTKPPPQRSTPDLVVLADEPPTREVVLGLHRDGVPHLRVALCDGRGVIGPLVLPGRTPCLRCLHQHDEDGESYWPAMAAATAAHPGRADPACAVATAGLAVAQAITGLDGVGAGGPPAAALGAVLGLDVTEGTLRRRVLGAHRACPCGGGTSAPGRDGETIMG